MEAPGIGKIVSILTEAGAAERIFGIASTEE
jgi:hypothetical protein